MNVKELLAGSPSESAQDRAEWMAYMGQMYREAEETAITLGWSLSDIDEVAPMYLSGNIA